MNRDASLQKIAAWIQREDEELLYEVDCGEPPHAASEESGQFVPVPYADIGRVAAVFRRLVGQESDVDGTLRWCLDDPLGLPMLDASEE